MEPEDDAQLVLKALEDSGMFDELRNKLMATVAEKEALQKTIFQLVQRSKHLPAPTDDRRTQAAASEMIRKELTVRVLEEIVFHVWQELDSEVGYFSNKIQDCSHAALCNIYEQLERETLDKLL